ncbi:nucleoside-diphosphate-sugar epimerase [Algoriphagus boseongensis]|uniref:Nucleoside-diphosphate-sugar epimerase n=1 Tax=Algoriphagus boseongensis TaxID=1442587 RepID=A0A4R6T9X3_9BACT|nr:NAD-dependent epimerase/dehydratase family protein [Algoriphagus boseongensis]TDQ19611.1 nucleoside-diphosphate-sugar epimerase [Algoriphagus boseongensis]
MKILITGGSGFLGRIMGEKLSSSHEIISLGRGKSNSISCNLSTSIPEIPKVDVIVHAAGKAHVIPKSEIEKQEFFSVNLNGTSHLLKGIKELPQLFIFISSVAVYGKEEGEEINEDFPLLGETPYAKSKIEAESLIQKWGEEKKVPVVILRLPLLIGPNPPGNLGAIIKSVKKGYYFRLGDGKAKKSMVLASDVAFLIPTLLNKTGVYNLTDGVNPSLAELDQKIASHFGKSVKSFPEKLLYSLAKIGDAFSFFPLNSYRVNKLALTLTFSDQKARKQLNWNPKPVLDHLFED